MWELLPLKGGGEPYRFLVGVDYIVGRKNCAILVQDDQSISRIHATFSVSHPQSNLSRHAALPVLTVKDTSKYGTFVNDEKVQPDSPMVLKSGDQVTCGVFHSKFWVKYEPLITCSSCLDVPEKSALNLAVLKLGGHVVNNWSKECTHLVMNSVKVTIKTICALICMRPIVKSDYFKELVNAVQTKLQLPTLESFCPPVDEPSIQSEQFDLSARQERRNIFNQKTFLFLNAKQYKKLSPAVTLGGGEAKLFPEGSKDIPLLDNPGTCVIDAGNANSQLSVGPSAKEWIDSTVSLLESKGLRAIPEAEIGLAVIFMSTEKYCNAQNHPSEESPTLSRAIISGPSLSESMAVDETIMAPPTFNTTAYVPNTEPQEQPDTWLEISGVQEVKETPRIGRRANVNVEDTSTVKESFTASSSGKTSSLFRNENKTAVEVKSQQLLPSAVSSTAKVSKMKDKTSQKQSDLMKTYFQAKKRERVDEDEKEMSAAKLAKLLDFSEDDPPLPTSSRSKNVPEHNRNKRVTTGTEPSSLSSEMSGTSACGNSKRHGDEPVSKIVTSELATPKKRKELDVFPAGDNELDEGEERTFDMGDQSQSDIKGIRKKRKLDAVDSSIKEEDVSMMADERRSEHMKSESGMKKELSESIRKPLKDETRIDEDAEMLPSRLLLTEFRTLVVSNLSRKSNLTQREDSINTVNYKKFKKVSYPGAGGFPNIIGGSDLIAHHAKKNSELEIWLRDEIKEQTQQAKEDSMADDLFRYNPKTAKRRR